MSGAGERSGGGAAGTLITGGAGFVGANLAHRLMAAGQSVVVLDNLSRPGVERNLEWLRDTHGDRLSVMVEDVRDAAAVHHAAARVDRIFHFAAQVAVTTSLVEPLEDFAVNAQGTLNVLEAARAQARPPSVLMTSTNKVYGGLEDVSLHLDGGRYAPARSTAFRRSDRSISTAPTAAPKVPPTSTCTTTRAATGSGRWCFA